jgi:AGCS family alanine or glycine:cation symporter
VAFSFASWVRRFILHYFEREGKDDEVNNKKSEGDISHFQALCTALSATVGTGNIAGVATAISLGGPGALFWMWVTGLLIGMATKYAEAFQGCYFREVDENGEQVGGPQVYLRHT